MKLPWLWLYLGMILIRIDYKNLVGPFSTEFLFRLRRYIKHSRQFNHISKHLKSSSFSGIFNSLLDVWNCGQTRSFVFDILRLSYSSDINECKNGTHDCDQDNGTCSNTPGSYTCQCRPGYTGNGRNCSGISYLVSSLLGVMYMCT